MKLKMTMLMLLAGVLGGGSAFAATQGQAVAGGQVGFALPMVGDLKDVADPGLAIGVQAMHQSTPRDRFGVGVSYISFGQDSDQGVDTEVSVISTLALSHHDIVTGGSARPFFEGGFGFARTQVNIAQSNATGPDVTKGTNQEDISPTFLVGLGFDMNVSQGAVFGVSIDYQHFFFKIGDVDGGGTLNFLAHLRI